MQAVICAAGVGSRLRPLTHTSPKILLPLGSKAVFECILEALLSCGITDVSIIVGYKAKKVEQTIGKKYKNCSLRYITNKDFKKSDNLYSMFLARDHITEDMIFFNGDMIFHANILKKIIESSHNDSFIVDSLHSEDNAVLAHISEGRLKEIDHVISSEVHGAVPGFFRLSQKSTEEYFKRAEVFFENGPRKGGFFFPLQEMCKDIPITPIYSEDSRWVNINTHDDYKRACRIAEDF